MLVQPLNDAGFSGPIANCVLRDSVIVLLLLIARRIGAVRASCKNCQEIGLCLADAVDKDGGDRSAASAQNKTVTRWLDRRPDPGEIVKETASSAHIHIVASSPGGTASPPAAWGIGPIGPTPDVAAAAAGPSVL